MRHPPYHLRPNKAIDRMTLVEAISRLERLGGLAEYTYYGFGGPYLEDFRLLYELLPGMKMVSIERDDETLKRQKFHRPCGTEALHLEYGEFSTFLARYQANDLKSVFWLDNTGLKFGHFEDFMTVLSMVAAGSMVKVTLQAEAQSYIGRPEEFRAKFDSVMPDPSADPPIEVEGFARLLQDMLQIAAQKALPSAMPLMFLPISSFHYSDGKHMFTLTGVICARDEQATIRKLFSDWSFANLDWDPPREIDIPILSTKERLHLQTMLPCATGAENILQKALGYLVDADERRSKAKLKQYADYHRSFPYFMRAIP